MSQPLRVLLLADTHIGLDLPVRPKINRRRRGDDFLVNFRRALLPALEGEVDLVVHGGDLFNRSRLPARTIQLGIEPLLEVAAAGVPVYLVPGNHERGRIPLHLWRAHPNLHIFDEPTTFSIDVRGWRVALAGFPFARKIQGRFAGLLLETGYERVQADVRLLCLHQTVEGAVVGPVDFVFRPGSEVIGGSQIPHGFAAVLSGHIHRSQILRTDLQGHPLAAPVIYPGSVERTSFAERFEDKHYVKFIAGDSDDGLELREISFCALPARPMETITLSTNGKSPAVLLADLVGRIGRLQPDAVVQVRIEGTPNEAALQTLSAPRLRAIAPPTMNISLSLPRRQPAGT